MDLHLNKKEIQHLDGESYLDVSVLSFIKCNIIAQLVFSAIIFGGLIAIGILLQILG